MKTIPRLKLPIAAAVGAALGFAAAGAFAAPPVPQVLTIGGQTLTVTNGLASGSGGFSLDLGATALATLKLYAPISPQIVVTPLGGPGDDVMASLSGGRVLVYASGGRKEGVSASPTGDIMVSPGASIELADISWPNIRVQVTAPADRPLNVTRLLAQHGQTGMFSGLFSQPRGRARSGADSPVMVATEALSGLNGSRYASPALSTLRFIESALREIALGKAFDATPPAARQAAVEVANVAPPKPAAQDSREVREPAKAVAREEIVVASIQPTDISAALNATADFTALLAKLSEPVEVRVSISESSIAALEPVAVRAPMPVVVAAVAVPASLSKPAAVAAPIVAPAAPKPVVAVAALQVLTAPMTKPAAIAATIAAPAAPKPVAAVSQAQLSTAPAVKPVTVAMAAPAAAPMLPKPAPVHSNEPVSAVAEMAADLPLTKRDILGEPESTKLARAEGPRLPRIMMDSKGGIFHL